MSFFSGISSRRAHFTRDRRGHRKQPRIGPEILAEARQRWVSKARLPQGGQCIYQVVGIKMLTLLSAGERCHGCQIVRKAIQDAKVAFRERDIRSLSNREIVDVVADLRLCGWNEKLMYSAEGNPILMAPIVWNPLGALWSSFLLPDGKTVRQEFLDVLYHRQPKVLYSTTTTIAHAKRRRQRS